MNKKTLMGWVLLMGLFLVWTNYKGKQAQEVQKQKLAQQKQDSLARVAKRPAGDTAAASPSAPAIAALGPAAMTAGGVPDSARKDSTALAAAAPRRLTLETNRLIVVLDNQGAKVARLGIKELHGKKPHQGELISPERGGAFLLTVNNQDLDKLIWRMEGLEAETLTGDSLRVKDHPAKVVFRAAIQGGEVTRTYIFHPDSTSFSHAFKTSFPVESYTLKWPSGLNETESIVTGKGIGLTSNFFSELVFDNGVTVMREAFEGKKTFNDGSGTVRWAGLRRKYVAAVMDFGQDTHHKIIAASRIPEGRENTYPKEYEVQVSGSEFEEKALDFSFEVLPLAYDQLKARGQNYEQIIFSGWEWFFRADVWYVGLCGLVLKLLKGFHDLIPNWGVAIILLTLLVRTVTFPLTIAQTKQGVRMTQHAPAISKIREKNKGNPQKMNLEIMEYYKKEGINPFASVMGCFPVLLQMPVFIALFNVLGRAVELKDAPFVAWIHDLSRPDVVLPALKVPYLFPVGLTVLPFFMAATMWLQMKMSIKDPNQKMMVWMMPIMMFVFSCSFPSGLVLYWTVSNIFTIGQTYFYTNKLTAKAKAQVGTRPAPPSGGKPVPRKPVKT
ncbi:MAG TPA: membrane protein insertase YidC [Fibrobacteria bacterium]|nr:membrane protein insertase YidC [Fibrobacteria bacterium]